MDKTEENLQKLRDSGIKFRRVKRGGYVVATIGSNTYLMWPKSGFWKSTTNQYACSNYDIDRLISLKEKV